MAPTFGAPLPKRAGVQRKIAKATKLSSQSEDREGKGIESELKGRKVYSASEPSTGVKVYVSKGAKSKEKTRKERKSPQNKVMDKTNKASKAKQRVGGCTCTWT